MHQKLCNKLEHNLEQIITTNSSTEKENVVDEKKSIAKKIWLDVTLFVHKHDYTAAAIGAGAIVGTFLLVKHFVKRK